MVAFIYDPKASAADIIAPAIAMALLTLIVAFFYFWFKPLCRAIRKAPKSARTAAVKGVAATVSVGSKFAADVRADLNEKSKRIRVLRFNFRPRRNAPEVMTFPV